MPTSGEIVNPNELLEIPSWINADYFKCVLEKDEPDYVKIIRFLPLAAIPPGDNFLSIMVRIHMDLQMKDGSVKKTSYILKTMLADDQGGSVVNKLSVFPKELKMYEQYLPAFEALYTAVGWHVQLAPKCLLTECRGEGINFVFEDLQRRKFGNINRLEGFDMPHMTAVLRKLAEFHAASAVYEERNGAYPLDLQKGFINEEGIEFQEKAFHTKVSAFKEAMAGWGLEEGEKYLKKFPTFEQYWRSGLRTLDQDPNAFNVLTHGDLWSSNIMLNYKPNGAIEEILFLDFQVCKWGTPAEDLLLFINISASRDIRIKEYDRFVEIYHERLIECLKVLKYQKALPKLRDLQMSMYNENSSFIAFFSIFNHLGVLLLPSDSDSNFQSFFSTDDASEQFRMRCFTNPQFVDAMRDMYPFYHRRGIFNFEDYDE